MPHIVPVFAIRPPGLLVDRAVLASCQFGVSQCRSTGQNPASAYSEGAIDACFGRCSARMDVGFLLSRCAMPLNTRCSTVPLGSSLSGIVGGCSFAVETRRPECGFGHTLRRRFTVPSPAVSTPYWPRARPRTHTRPVRDTVLSSPGNEREHLAFVQSIFSNTPRTATRAPDNRDGAHTE